MAKSHKRSHSDRRHPALRILLHPVRFLVMSLMKILASPLAHPTQTCTFLILAVTAVYFFDTIDSIVAWVLPFKPFHLLYSHIKSSSINILESMIAFVWNLAKDFQDTLLMATGVCGVVSRHQSPYAISQLSKNHKYPLRLTSSVLVSLDEPENSLAETTNLLQLSNALLFMDMELGNHTKISAQVRHLAHVYSLFTDQIEKLDLAGIHLIEVIAQEYFKAIYQNKHSRNHVVVSLLNFSNYEVENLQADVTKTLESACNLLTEQDLTSILFHEEISFLQNARYRHGLWGFQKFGSKKLKTKETLIFLDRNRANLKHSWTTLEKQRRNLILFLERIQHMRASSLIYILIICTPAAHHVCLRFIFRTWLVKIPAWS
ncbi:hypothetical protein MJO29_006592 [Puccinia striiformis f. sp. tritici]|uniref:Uncharacterized protein n=1 Tax=Puccinia striiformis f. sp. tritici PST-78 TaxID=1165861 RepID=A0A0L0VV42_9BASI|nr:hypothetical protein MJO29_006592 [Puccinia striiformis f. sp. tritici]KAI9629382.1 hypothetical protein KEM48_013048 [Puccinia striiformis f. sp. tritici PST-130]KNF03169.1 hypothetical protein PSTG_03756 [Puccinia striiformis f. sp. tritici PST-78]